MLKGPSRIPFLSHSYQSVGRDEVILGVGELDPILVGLEALVCSKSDPVAELCNGILHADPDRSSSSLS